MPDHTSVEFHTASHWSQSAPIDARRIGYLREQAPKSSFPIETLFGFSIAGKVAACEASSKDRRYRNQNAMVDLHNLAPPTFHYNPLRDVS
jgi:hypothetical protein